MKLKNKIITLALVITLVFGMTLLTIGAESSEKLDTGAYFASEYTSLGASGVDADKDLYDEAESIDATDENKVSDGDTSGNEDSFLPPESGEGDPEDGANGGNIFETIYEGFEMYSAEIMSLLAFIGSIILAICYRSGLMPLIQNALGSMLGALGKLKENVDASEENAGRITSALTERLESAENILSELGDAVAKMSKAIEAGQSVNEWHEQMKTVLTGHIDMLYDIFMTSALPQYQKDAVGERVRAMRDTIIGGDGGNDA